MSQWENFELQEATVADLQAAMENGDHTARSITELYLKRIDQMNTSGPELRAIIETNPDALVLADQLDTERRDHGPRGPLHGIPVIIKDNIDTADAMTTTAGSLALEGSTPAEDACIIERLRAAGAIVLAKANMSEWAYFRGERATSGWSARGGQCRNPYALDRNPCGSSSGSGVAASANLAAITIGTETNGSIMCPSSMNGIVGIKPTVGLWSRTGIIPISHSQDTAGPMARTVADAVALLGPLAGPDPSDAATTTADANVLSDYTQCLDPGSLRGARIGVARNFDGFHPLVVELFEAALDQMRNAGAVVIDGTDLGTTTWTDKLPLTVLEYEFRDGLNNYLANLGHATLATIDDLVEFNGRNADRELIHFGQQRIIAAAGRGGLDETEYLDALHTVQRSTRDEGIDQVMDTHNLDALVAPTADLAWPTDHIKGDRRDGGSSAGPAAIAGYPNITVPMGQVRGLPAGISFFGRAWSEPTLIGIAYAYEQATRHRTPPTFVATLG
ncbi:amidase [bacterium]|nr:amidase [bacterium]